MPYVPLRQVQRYRFVDFEFREKTGELSRKGETLHLQHQAGLVLQALLHARGEMVSREELKETLWPGKVSGDFESGLNVAVRKLRVALNDEGANPVIIGTLAGHGYRMLVEVEVLDDAAEVLEENFPNPGASFQTQDEPPAGQPVVRRWLVRLRATPASIRLAAAALMLVLAGFLYGSLGRNSIHFGKTPGEILKDRDSGIKFVWAPPGTFVMGSPQTGYYSRQPDETQHQVSFFTGFWIGRFEVTQREYASVMGTNPSGFKEPGPDAPVENVSWEDTQAFLVKLNQRGHGQTYRLPTEAEWEYACRAGTTGDSYASLNICGWWWGNADRKTHPVGLKLPNAWGLYDTLGNVWEWCQDWYGTYPAESETDPPGPPKGLVRVYRGGSWDSCETVAHRGSQLSSDTRFSTLGFRVVCLPRVERAD